MHGKSRPVLVGLRVFVDPVIHGHLWVRMTVKECAIGTDSMVNMGSNDKAFLAAICSMSDGDDVTRLDRIN
jgi:hypothetical protein